jgi:hypothetical protein
LKGQSHPNSKWLCSAGKSPCGDGDGDGDGLWSLSGLTATGLAAAGVDVSGAGGATPAEGGTSAFDASLATGSEPPLGVGPGVDTPVAGDASAGCSVAFVRISLSFRRIAAVADPSVLVVRTDRGEGSLGLPDGWVAPVAGVSALSTCESVADDPAAISLPAAATVGDSDAESLIATTIMTGAASASARLAAAGRMFSSSVNAPPAAGSRARSAYVIGLGRPAAVGS